LNLYASRELSEGISYSPDTLWQREFEAGFEYEETEDQFEAIEDVKRDMEAPKPMDRLVCGDVGYGKTEVAIRAAFKSIMDGKQAAVLVPTTVLAQQHLQTFTQRMKTYPVSIESLSRFRSKTEQKKIIENLKKGKVDIIIGTHRLLQKDVKYNDLGLLIIDEEHRFGVKDKEKIKEIKKNVDVLTLTATPIPRTLHMALSQIRNLSIIDTPPENRLPIHTVVAKFNKKIIKEAIEKELERDGQVYFIHNRVQNIDNIARLISDLVPNARIAVAHGQMKERHLEKVMINFLSGVYDVLVCSTIIESGIDIPSVNTIIINRADTFGLAQLYQLRGRVGRDKYQAHAYLIIPGHKLITETARKRLAIIQEMTQLGSGFRIATHDLEIRGAGNILGEQQHGHMNAIGYDLYIQLLSKTIEELKGNITNGDFVSHIDIATGAKIPEFYISGDNQRLMMYKKISMSRNIEDLTDLRQEFADRFGNIPDEVIQLLRIAELKIRAQKLMIKEISRVENSLKFSFDNDTPIDPEKMVKLIHRFPKRVRFISQNEVLYDLPLKVTFDIVDQVKGVLNLLD
ncbi:transcription-repair coupling factor, partial [bacterium]|nr:transcription-repair coupling factor [bacterium]